MTHEWEKIHRTRKWGTYPDIHMVRQVHKFMAQYSEQMKDVPFDVRPLGLDIGCGTGACSFMMNRAGIDVTCFDVSETAIKGLWDYMPSDSSVFPLVSGVDTFTTDDQYDIILDNLSLTCLERPPWDRIMSWLKPGGWLVHASFEMAPKGTPRAWEHKSPGDVVERHSAWVEGNAFSLVVRKYVKPGVAHG